jgi:LPXTG-motif cell wall-anchored protein
MEWKEMNVTIIRVLAGVLAVAVLFIIVWRRKRKTIE